jgi:hypothetical protein
MFLKQKIYMEIYKNVGQIGALAHLHDFTWFLVWHYWELHQLLFMAHGKQLRPWNASRQLFLWTALSYGFPIVFSPNGEFMWMLLITKRHYFTILKTVLQRIHWVIQGEQHDSIVTFSKIYCKDIGSSSKDLKSGWYPVTYHLTIVFIIGTMSLVKTC